ALRDHSSNRTFCLQSVQLRGRSKRGVSRGRREATGVLIALADFWPIALSPQPLHATEHLTSYGAPRSRGGKPRQCSLVRLHPRACRVRYAGSLQLRRGQTYVSLYKLRARRAAQRPAWLAEGVGFPVTNRE